VCRAHGAGSSSYHGRVPSASQTFPPGPESVRAARRFAGETVSAWAGEALEDDVRSVVTELATNAVLHARTPFVVSLTLAGDRLRVAVADGSPVRPRIPRHSRADATTGRGLGMVAQLALAWGVESWPGGVGAGSPAGPPAAPRGPLRAADVPPVADGVGAPAVTGSASVAAVAGRSGAAVGYFAAGGSLAAGGKSVWCEFGLDAAGEDLREDGAERRGGPGEAEFAVQIFPIAPDVDGAAAPGSLLRPMAAA
jgi:anti-sigma regulatory factor (Ser/Thr protein kinase)